MNHKCHWDFLLLIIIYINNTGSSQMSGPYLAEGQGGQLPPQRFDKVTITLLEVSYLPPPPSNKRKYISTAPLLKNG